MLRSDFSLTENFADQNDENECDVTEASYIALRKVVITAEGGVTAVRFDVCTLYLDVHDFFKSNSSAKAVVSKVKNSIEKTTSIIPESCSSTKTNLFLDWIVRPVGV